MDPLARNVMLRWASGHRVVERFVSAKAKEVPVRNKDYDDKIVWVKPETLKKDPSKYKAVPPKELEQPWVPQEAAPTGQAREASSTKEA
jgi:hypothetical protein